MGERELREKYGGKLPKAINRAIRAEVAGGNAALDKLTQLAGQARHSGWKSKTGKPTAEAEAYHKHQELIAKMEAQVRARWKIPASAGGMEFAPRSPGRPASRPKPRPAAGRSAKPARRSKS
jgi:hypothetical protein